MAKFFVNLKTGEENKALLLQRLHESAYRFMDAEPESKPFPFPRTNQRKRGVRVMAIIYRVYERLIMRHPERYS